MIVHSLTLLLAAPFLSKSGMIKDQNSLNLFVITSNGRFYYSC
jgi:hypothetical protein